MRLDDEISLVDSRQSYMIGYGNRGDTQLAGVWCVMCVCVYTHTLDFLWLA